MNLDSSIYRVLIKGIQNFRKKQLRNKIIEIKSLFVELNEISKNRFEDELFKNSTKVILESFDKLTIKIQDKYNIKKVKEFIDVYKKNYVTIKKLDEKIFLSLWLFSAFPDIVLEPQTKIKKDLNDLSSYLVGKINELCINDELIYDKRFFEDFNKYINKYTVYFDIFFKLDKKDKIIESIESYVTIKKNIIKIDKSQKYDKNEKQEIIKLMILNLNTVKKFILSHNKNFDFENLDKLVDEIINLENIKIKNYITVIEKKLDVKDYDYILSLLKDIQLFIKKMNKIEDLTTLEEIIDPEYIIQLIKNDLLNKDEIINFGLNLVNKITNSGSIRLSELKEEEIKKFINQNIKFNNLLANIIYINLESIYLVYDEIISFQELKTLDI